MLEARNQLVPKTHSLNRLFALVGEDIQEIDSDLLHTLDGLYIESRYPGEFGLLPNGKPSLGDARSFYDFAVSSYETVFKQIPQQS